MTQPHEHYLRDVVPELLNRAREATATARRDRDPFATGRATAYYEVVSHVINQLDAFGIDRSSVAIPTDLDLEGELI